MKSDPSIALHISIVSAHDLGLIQRELFSIDSNIKAHGSSVVSRIKPSGQLDNLIKSSGIDLGDDQQRQLLSQQLQFVRRTAPNVTLVFAKRPDSRSLLMLVKWFRENGHPNTLINAVTDPSVGGGCVVKTASKTFDFSYHKLFSKQPIKLTR